jgi:5-formyltetrahydrofolate cyclo-ligase
MYPAHDSAKPVTRRLCRERRRSRPVTESERLAVLLAAHAERLVEDRKDSATVAVYVSLPGEPGTGPLRDRMRALGHRVLLPVLRDDRDLDWVVDTGDGPTGEDPTSSADPLRPPGPRLGPEAVTGCDVVLLPALAVDGAGTRLGQGGGSYDRSLSRLDLGRPAGAGRPLLLAVVHDEELLEGTALPRQAHDVPVDGVLTPGGLSRTGA